MTVGNNTHFMPNVTAAKYSAANIFEILDADDEDQLQVKSGFKLIRTPIKGNIGFNKVDFKHESRDEFVFRRFEFRNQGRIEGRFFGGFWLWKIYYHSTSSAIL
jgi:hypothetical protein